MRDEQKYLRERLVVRMRGDGASWATIGKRLGVSGERARQIHRDATWPTSVAERRRVAYEQKLRVNP